MYQRYLAQQLVISSITLNSSIIHLISISFLVCISIFLISFVMSLSRMSSPQQILIFVAFFFFDIVAFGARSILHFAVNKIATGFVCVFVFVMMVSLHFLPCCLLLQSHRGEFQHSFHLAHSSPIISNGAILNLRDVSSLFWLSCHYHYCWNFCH